MQSKSFGRVYEFVCPCRFLEGPISAPPTIQYNSNRLAGFMNSLALDFEMVDLLKNQFQLEQQRPIVTLEAFD